MNITLSTIRMDGGTQSRAAIDSDTVRDYAADMQGGATFPPLVLYHDGADHWLADGFHRVQAAQAIGLTELAADVRQGTRRDAVLHSVGANAVHGLRRTTADKRRAVEYLLNDAEWSGWSNREIARRCDVSLDLVNRMRAETSLNESFSDERTYTTKHGTVATMHTASIGTNRPVSPNGDKPLSTMVDKMGTIVPTPRPVSPNVDSRPIHRIPVDDYDSAPDEPPAVQVDEDELSPYEQQLAARFTADDPPPDDTPTPAPLRDRQPSALAVVESVPLPISQQAGYESDEWYTPPLFVEAARAVLGRIDVDPASNPIAQQTIRALAHYTKEDDGLLQEWHGAIFINPPFSMAGKFVTKLIAEYDARHVKQAVILLNGSTDTSWFHELAARFPMCFTRGRIGFLRADGKPIEGNRQGQVFFYLGANVARFAELFAPIGTVVARSDMARMEVAA